MIPYRGATRQEMEQAGRALPKKIYQCGPCGMMLTHDECSRHELFECSQRKGSTVKPSKRKAK